MSWMKDVGFKDIYVESLVGPSGFRNELVGPPAMRAF